jgi:hypothetical protein
VQLTKNEAHQSVMGPFAYFVDQVPEYDLLSSVHRITKFSNCSPSRLQIIPSFLRQLTAAGLTKYYSQVGNINNDLIRKIIDVLLRLRNFLGG